MYRFVMGMLGLDVTLKFVHGASDRKVEEVNYYMDVVVLTDMHRNTSTSAISKRK